MISFVPTRLNDLVVDVLISSPSSGEVLSFDGSRWANSPAYARKDQANTFTASQTVVGVMTATAFSGSGTLLNDLDATQISSGTLGDARLSSNVPLKNAANTFTAGPQTVQTGADANKGVVAKRNSSSQTANLYEGQDEGGVALFRVSGKGSVRVNGQFGENAIEVFKPDGSSSIFRVLPDTGEVQTSGDFTTNSGFRIGAFGAYVGVLSFCRFTFPSSGVVCHPGQASNVGLTIQGDTAQSANLLELWGKSSTSDRAQGSLTTDWVDSTDATRKARITLSAFDTAAREVMRGEGTGSAAAIGFLGASAIARPTVTGSRGGNAALASLLTALASLGLITDSTTA